MDHDRDQDRNRNRKAGMATALQLTRQGRLGEAVAVIQRTLGASEAPPDSGSAERRTRAAPSPGSAERSTGASRPAERDAGARACPRRPDTRCTSPTVKRPAPVASISTCRSTGAASSARSW